MNILYLLFYLIITPLSYAFYGPSERQPDIDLGTDVAVFRIGRDIYSCALFPNYIVKLWIDEDGDFYGKSYTVKEQYFDCSFCFSFVLRDDLVLTLTGYEDSDAANSSYTNNMGVYYFNPKEMTVRIDSNYKMLQGNPTQRLFHQAVMTPDNKSVYIFGGINRVYGNQTYISIEEFDVSSSTFTSHGNFSFVGGTATMLPSGIVVLAFGASDFNVRYGNALYDTSSVYLYDTNTNELYKQNISGTPPQPRASASGTLGPDNECIYYYGGNNFDLFVNPVFYLSGSEIDRLHIRSDLVVLNTTSWTWYHPNVSGPQNNGRYGHFSLLYEDNTLIIGGGTTLGHYRDDISVLRNLPLGRESSSLDKLQWFTNSDLDENDGDDNNNKLGTGAIVGIAIGIGIPMTILFYFLWKKIEPFRAIIWKRRFGEPVWIEILRTITRIILLGVLLAYVVYAIVRAIDSPNLNEEQVVEMKRMPLPDIRVCSGSHEPAGTAFDAACTLQNGQDCSKYFYPLKNASIVPFLDRGYYNPSCQVFLPPLDIYFESNDDTYGFEKNSMLTAYFTKQDTNKTLESFYVTYYSSQNSPYRTLFGLNEEDSKMSLQDANNWIEKEQDENTFKTDVVTIVTAGYSLTESRLLTNSSWNYFGFANIYDTSLSITQNVGHIALSSNSSSSYDSLFTLYVNPSEYSIKKVTEQRVSTILGGLASAGGVFSVIIAIQTLLFGFRPNSPWGIVHRWSWGRQRKALREQLREGFNKDDVPVPMATRVYGDYQLPTSAFTTIDIPPMNNDNDNQNHGLRLRTVEERIQLMEDLFKTYYIDDEIFQKLNEARRDKSTKDDEKEKRVRYETGFPTFHQEDEEMPFYKTS